VAASCGWGTSLFVGSHRVNGVSALHTGLMRETVFKDLHALYPDRIVNKTNGVTFRRWLLQANPALVKVLCDVCGNGVLDDPSLIAKLADATGDAAVREPHRRGQARQQSGLEPPGRGPRWRADRS
jgi:starch phosphorylase